MIIQLRSMIFQILKSKFKYQLLTHSQRMNKVIVFKDYQHTKKMLL